MIVLIKEKPQLPYYEASNLHIEVSLNIKIRTHETQPIKKKGDGVIFYTLKITLPIFLFDKPQLEPVAEAYGKYGEA